MDTNNEEWKNNVADSIDPQKNEESKLYRSESTGSGERPQRPRIQRSRIERAPVYPKSYGNESGYGDNNSYDRERPQYNRPYGGDENTGAQSGGDSNDYRPRRPRVENSYGGEQNYRPRYNSSDPYDAYSNRRPQGGDRGWNQGYRSNQGDSNDRPYNRGYNDRGGYGERTNNYNDRSGGYGNRGGYGDRNNSYGDRNNYGDRGSSYGDRGGYSNNRGGYNDRGSNYGNRNSYGQNNYGDRGGYNSGDRNSYRPRYNQGGGYGNSQGGYNRPSRPGYNPDARYTQKKQIEYKEVNVDPDALIRLNKYLANAGICSRREADEFIQAGVVSVNGEVVKELGTKVKRADEVKFHDQPVNMERKTYILLNKPKDCVTTLDDPQERKTVMEFVKDACKERIYPVGRLDRNTTGVLLLTNDGELASKLTHPKFLKKKVYQVTLDRIISKEDLDKIATGITLEDGEIQADAVGYSDEEDRRKVGIEIHSGKNRIVRRIFESLGYRVIKLDRVLFAGLTKKALRRGDWRYLTEPEVNMLRMGAFE